MPFLGNLVGFAKGVSFCRVVRLYWALFLLNFTLNFCFKLGIFGNGAFDMGTRTPRNFDGTRFPGIKIEEILPDLLAGIDRKRGVPREAVFREWALLLGEKMASFTQPVSFEDGVLTVIVKSSTLYSLLRVHEKPRLLRKLQDKFQVKNLVFKIG